MSSFIEGGPVGILCRDFGFLPEQEGFRKIEVKIHDAHVRKGNYQYTSALVDQLKSWCSGWFDEIVVIGDGEGDIRFSINLYLGTKESCRVSGLFIRHEATHPYENEGTHVALFDDWDLLSASLDDLLVNRAKQCGSPGRILVLVDVDRTVIFPRLLCDQDYADTRYAAMIDFVAGFRSDSMRAQFGSQIRDSVDLATKHLREYAENQLNGACFKNEEVVALATLMLSVGAIRPNWIVQRPQPHQFESLLVYTAQAVENGGWISGLDLRESDGQDVVPGENVWKREELARELRASLQLLRNKRPVLSPTFRQHEARRLSTIITSANGRLFNQPLIEALRTMCPVLFLSDRPALSLGISPNGTAFDLGGGRFWVELSQHLSPKGR